MSSSKKLVINLWWCGNVGYPLKVGPSGGPQALPVSLCFRDAIATQHCSTTYSRQEKKSLVHGYTLVTEVQSSCNWKLPQWVDRLFVKSLFWKVTLVGGRRMLVWKVSGMWVRRMTNIQMERRSRVRGLGGRTLKSNLSPLLLRKTQIPDIQQFPGTSPAEHQALPENIFAVLVQQSSSCKAWQISARVAE